MITQKRLKQFLTYKKGDLYWNHSGKKFGQPYTNKSTKLVIGEILGDKYFLHRLVWLYHRGEYPEVVNFKDGDPSNTKITNLKKMNGYEHKQCRGKPNKPTSSQYKGAWYNSYNDKWYSGIQANGIRRHLGSFDNELDAAKAYDKAAKKLHGNYAVINFPDK